MMLLTRWVSSSLCSKTSDCGPKYSNQVPCSVAYPRVLQLLANMLLTPLGTERCGHHAIRVVR